MNKSLFLKNNPVFWSRLGFCYDPPLKNEKGKPLVFTENFEKQLATHQDFFKAGIKIHTSILHLGWMGINEYDYSLTDRVLESIFSMDENVYYIPRIKLNVPIDWCKENPEEVFVYYGGPETADEIAALVGTGKQDFLGYEAPNGYYRAGEYTDPRPNVGGMIARQSFSSKKWLEDAGEAFSRLIDHLESGPYGNRILGYHIAYGTSGETVLWGRISKRYGDYGISNKKAFYAYGLNKYKTRESLEKAWGQPNINEHNVIIPSHEIRTKKADTLEEFFRGRDIDRVKIDYDLFTSESNAKALEYFGKIVKEKTGKLVGAFYGYSLYINNAAYTGHLALDYLLKSPYIDFFAAPKAYARCGAGEPGGEICPAQSINLSKLFVEEIDNRTYLANECEEDKKHGWVSEGVADTLTVLWREFTKNLTHNSGFWWMDLGGGWFASEPIMTEIKKMVELNQKIRSLPHQSVADMLIVFDERSMLSVQECKGFHKYFLREFINETNCSGVIADVYRASDLKKLDLKQYKFIVFAYNFYMDQATRDIISALPDNVTVAFSYAAGVWNENGFSFKNAEEITGFRYSIAAQTEYDFPAIKAEKLPSARKNNIAFTSPGLKSSEIRNFAKTAGCHIYTENDAVTIYADNRLIGIFNKNPGGKILLSKRGNYRDLISGTKHTATDLIPLPSKENSVMLLIEE